MSSALPLIDLARARTDARAVATQIDTACRDTGFLLVTGAGIDPAIINEARRASRSFFALPYPAKQAVARPHPSHIRGYSGIGTEALAQLEEHAVPPDLKELFDVGPPHVPADDDYYARAGASFTPNVWPVELPELQPALVTYFHAMADLAQRLAHLFALALDLPVTYFDPMIDRHISILRANYYPRQLTPPLPRQLRGGAHTDYTAYTILWQETVAGGLELLDRAGHWRAVPPVADSFVVNIGDSLARWTNDTWVSTMHRVVNPPPEVAATNDRLSLVFFFQPNYDAIIECIPTCQSAERPPRYAPIANGEFLAQKFADQQYVAT